MQRDLDYMIAVMQAAKEGREVQMKLNGKNTWVSCVPVWDWRTTDYRIKPEEPKPEYVPYENQFEFLADQKIHGPYVSFKNRLNELRFFIPALVVNDGVYVHFGGDNEDVLVKYSNLKFWQDGTPCGKSKES